MSKAKHLDDDPVRSFIPKPVTEMKIYQGFKYVKNKDGTVTGSRNSINSEVAMKSLVKRWNEDVDTTGFYAGEVTTSKYVPIPSYEEALKAYGKKK